MESEVQWRQAKRSNQPLDRGGRPARKPLSTLAEVFAETSIDAAAVAFMISGLPRRDTAPVLWVQDRLSQRETGRPYLPGLAGWQILQVDVNRPVDVLWAMEEGLRCKALSGVIGEIWGDPAVLDFTATKRLALRAERHDVPCWLMRRAAMPNLSAARSRWRVASLPALPHPHDPKAPGDPRWQVELFRARDHRTGTWVASYDRAADRVDLSAPVRNGAVAEGDGAQEHRAAR